jgi:hypothetical protein
MMAKEYKKDKRLSYTRLFHSGLPAPEWEDQLNLFSARDRIFI